MRRDGKDVVVQQMITNYGEKPIDYTAFSIYPGEARQERLVTNLGPGQTTIKRYRFNGVKNLARGWTRHAGLKLFKDFVSVFKLLSRRISL